MYEVITTSNVMFQVNKGHMKYGMVYDIIAKIKLDMCITIKNIVLKYENV
jgi:hypothetical protein